MVIKRISNNVGWDGNSYCCLHCGKSGYKSIAAAKGHLAMCQAKAGVFPGQLAGQLVGVANNGGLQERRPATWPASYSLAGTAFSGLPFDMASYEQQQQQLAAQVSQLQNLVNNELTHLQQYVSQNQNQQPQNWWKWLLVAGLVLFGFWAFAGSGFCECPASGGSGSGGSGGSGSGGNGPTRRPGPDMRKLGERVLNKAVDTGITKAFGKLF